MWVGDISHRFREPINSRPRQSNCFLSIRLHSMPRPHVRNPTPTHRGLVRTPNVKSLHHPAHPITLNHHPSTLLGRWRWMGINLPQSVTICSKRTAPDGVTLSEADCCRNTGKLQHVNGESFLLSCVHGTILLHHTAPHANRSGSLQRIRKQQATASAFVQVVPFWLVAYY